MALPTIIEDVAPVSVASYKNKRLPPILRGTAVYVVMIPGGNSQDIAVRKATDPTSSFSEQDSANRPSNGVGDIMSLSHFVLGDDIHIVSQYEDASGMTTVFPIRYHVFHMATDAWDGTFVDYDFGATDPTNEGNYSTTAAANRNASGVSITGYNTGTSDPHIRIQTPGASITDMGSDYRTVTHHRRDGGTWSLNITVAGTAGTDFATGPSIVDANDRVYYVYGEDGGSTTTRFNRVKGLSTGNSLSSAVTLSDSSAMSANNSHYTAGGVAYDDGGTETIAVAVRDDVGDLVVASWASADTPGTITTSSPNADGNEPRVTDIAGLDAAVAWDASGDMHAVWVKSSNVNPFHDVDSGSGWGTDDWPFNTSSTDQHNRMDAAVYTRSGTKVLALIARSNSRDRYDEYELTGGATTAAGTDGEEFSDSATSQLDAVASGSDSGDLSDTATSRIDAVVSGSDIGDFSDSAQGAVTAPKSGSDVAEFSDSATSVVIKTSTGSDVAEGTDVASSRIDAVADGSDVGELSDSADSTITAVDSGSDVAEVSDSATTALTAPVSGSDIGEFSDSASSLVKKVVSGSDVAEGSDVASSRIDAVADGSDIGELSDVAAGAITAPKSASDVGEFSDVATASKTVGVSASDSMDASDTSSSELVSSVVQVSASDVMKATDQEYIFPIMITASPNILASGEPTTAQLTPPAGKTTGDFTAGRIQDDENPTDAVDIAVDDYTELEWTLEFAPNAETGQYRFRVVIDDGTEDGVTVDAYDVQLRITITAAEAAAGADSGEFSDDASSRLDAVAQDEDSANASDTANSTITAVNSESDAGELSDSVVDVVTAPVNGADVGELSDSATVAVTKPSDGADVGEFSDSATARVTSAPTASDVIEASDSASSRIDAVASASDGIEASDTALSDAGALAFDSMDASDTADSTITGVTTGSDAGEFSDTATATRVISVSASDGMEASDTGDTALTAVASGSDTFDISDDPVEQLIVAAIAEDIAKFSDVADGGIESFGVDVGEFSDTGSSVLTGVAAAFDGGEFSDVATANVISGPTTVPVLYMHYLKLRNNYVS